jgi:hypothetical protein
MLAGGYWMFLSCMFLAFPVSAQTTTNEIPPLSPAYGELPPTFWELHQSAILVACFAILAFAFFFLKAMLRPESPKILPPEDAARQALANLKSQPEDGKALSAVSQILRRYLSERFGLPGHELTTAEFCSAIAGNEPLGADLGKTISSFLRECDARKFSPATGAPPLHAASRALELVEKANSCRNSANGSPGASLHQRSSQ